VIDVDPRFGELLERVVPRAGDYAADWDDVLRRAARRRQDSGSDRPRLRIRSRRAWYTVAAAALLTVVVGNPAFGIAARVLEWFQGSPAPERVERNLAALNEAVGVFEREGAAVIAERARGVTATETKYGRVYLWAAPMVDGAWCIYAETPSSGEPTAVVDCQDRPDARPLLVMQTSNEDGTFGVLAGRAEPPIRSLEARFGDGSTEAIPLVGRFFLYAMADGEGAVALIARDDRGRIVSHEPILFRVRSE
jgi:hypothetical protein